MNLIVISACRRPSMKVDSDVLRTRTEQCWTGYVADPKAIETEQLTWVEILPVSRPASTNVRCFLEGFTHVPIGNEQRKKTRMPTEI